MDGFISSKRNFEDFKQQIPQTLTSKFEELRGFCLSLGDNVVEDVRMHRVVFSKSFSFRWFADLEPDKNEILLKIQTSRKLPQTTIVVKENMQLDNVKEIIQQAYEKIR